jgi:hypothetical protein
VFKFSNGNGLAGWLTTASQYNTSITYKLLPIIIIEHDQLQESLAAAVSIT